MHKQFLFSSIVPTAANNQDAANATSDINTDNTRDNRNKEMPPKLKLAVAASKPSAKTGDVDSLANHLKDSATVPKKVPLYSTTVNMHRIFWKSPYSTSKLM